MIREKDLHSYLDSWVTRRFPRFLGNRFFQGTIRSVAPGAFASTFICTLSRTNESVADGNTYLCSTPGYGPRAGDVVVCVNLSSSTALILWPVNRPSTPRCMAFRAAALNLTSNSVYVIVPFDAVSDDPYGDFDITTGQYTVRVAGTYHLDSRIATTAGARSLLAAFVNGVVAKVGTDNATAGQVRGHSVSCDLRLAVGDVVDVRWDDLENVARAIDVGASAAYFNIHFIGG